MCFGQLPCLCVSLCTVTSPALGSVTEASTIEKHFTVLARGISGLFLGR